jgi:hypothetical protein
VFNVANCLEPQPLHHPHDLVSPDALINFDRKALPREGINHGQRPEPLAIE